jgi:hypothetical protein
MFQMADVYNYVVFYEVLCQAGHIAGLTDTTSRYDTYLEASKGVSFYAHHRTS